MLNRRIVWLNDVQSNMNVQLFVVEHTKNLKSSALVLQGHTVTNEYHWFLNCEYFVNHPRSEITNASFEYTKCWIFPNSLFMLHNFNSISIQHLSPIDANRTNVVIVEKLAGLRLSNVGLEFLKYQQMAQRMFSLVALGFCECRHLQSERHNCDH